jgi:NTP pyrophosphatase (non-canonical NTP hydrolase)
MMTIREFQAAHGPWVKHNFGDRPAHWPLLGIGEELGELSHAQLKMEQGIRGTREEHLEKQKDAIADVVVFAADYCSSMGWDLQDIVGFETFSQLQASLLKDGRHDWELVFRARKHLGKLDDAFLKESELMGRDALRSIFTSLAAYCNRRGWDMHVEVMAVWAKVSQRDWKKNAKTGGDLDAPKVTGVDWAAPGTTDQTIEHTVKRDAGS